MVDRFTGFPESATDFYAQLELDNTREFWQAHQETYQEQVRAPMEALLAELADDFGTAKIFRPHRDVRFSADKSPYKTHQGGYVQVAEATGWYAEVSADGFRVGGGCYRMEPAALTAYRQAVADDRRGAALERIVADLRAGGWEVSGDRLKTAPRGFDREHPRIELLRHRSPAVMRWITDLEVVTSPALVAQVRLDWGEARPLVQWLAGVTGPTPARTQ
jgi:uncharacterized protein (TIGR02453 family)